MSEDSAEGETSPELLPWELADTWTAQGVGPSADRDFVFSGECAEKSVPAQEKPIASGQYLEREEYASKLRESFLDFIRRREKHRNTALVIVGILTGMATAASIGAMTAYICFKKENIEASVMISFFGSVVVEIIGLFYIIISFLFQKGDHSIEEQINKQEERISLSP